MNTYRFTLTGHEEELPKVISGKSTDGIMKMSKGVIGIKATLESKVLFKAETDQMAVQEVDLPDTYFDLLLLNKHALLERGTIGEDGVFHPEEVVMEMKEDGLGKSEAPIGC